MVKSLISKGLTVPQRREKRYISIIKIENKFSLT
jgi:hypothetical protein